MPLFDADYRLTSDACSIQARDNENQSRLDYIAFDPGFDREKAAMLAQAHPNLRRKDGYGLDPSMIDQDSCIKKSALQTASKERQPLTRRYFFAAPNLTRGLACDALTCHENALIMGDDTTVHRQCGTRLSEMDFDRYAPNVRPVRVDNVVPDWTWGGASSRDISRTPEFMKFLKCRSSHI